MLFSAINTFFSTTAVRQRVVKSLLLVTQVEVSANIEKEVNEACALLALSLVRQASETHRNGSVSPMLWVIISKQVFARNLMCAGNNFVVLICEQDKTGIVMCVNSTI
jgi:predicted XRE-type DNA-binding protein